MVYKLYSLILLLVTCATVARNGSKSSDMKSFKDGDDKKVLVFDDLFPQDLLTAFFSLVSYGSLTGSMSSWSYNSQDYYQQIRTPNASNNLAWVAPMNPEFFMKTAIWERTREVLEEFTGGKAYYPYDASMSMSRRLDFTTVDTGS